MKKELHIHGRMVAVTVERHQEGEAAAALKLTACCGATTRSGVLTVMPVAARTSSQLQRDIDDFAQRLAEEAAGHETSRVLLDDILGPAPAKDSSQQTP